MRRPPVHSPTGCEFIAHRSSHDRSSPRVRTAVPTRARLQGGPVAVTDQDQVLDTVGELAQVLLSEETMQTTLQRIVDLASGVIEHVDGVSVTLFENGRP